MKKGRTCALHPELEGLRYNGGNCVQCSKDAHKAHRKQNKEKIAEARRAARAENPDKFRAFGAKWRAENATAVRENNLRRTGFTITLLEQTLRMQGNCCAICGTDLSSIPSKQVHADHCHATGAPRGVLCHYCNIALGAFRDNPALLQKAIAYLESPPLSIA